MLAPEFDGSDLPVELRTDNVRLERQYLASQERPDPGDNEL
jgi:hypothetical protein